MFKGLILTIIFFMIFLMSKSLLAYENNDLQSWNITSIEGNLSDYIKVKMEAEYRFGNDLKEYYYQHTDTEISIKALSWLYAGFNYRQIYELNKNTWAFESRPYPHLGFKFEKIGFVFDDRSKFEYRIRKGREDAQRYRNKFTIVSPLKITLIEIQPFAGDEIFYDLNKSKLNLNWFYAGVKYKLCKSISFETYYLMESSKINSSWRVYNVFANKLLIKI